MGFEFKPNKKRETINKTVRFPKELVEEIERQVSENDSYFSNFVIQACEYAVKESQKNFNYHEDENS